jgi:hypothetical protein
MKRWASIAVAFLICACLATVGCSFRDGSTQSSSGKLSTTSDVTLWGPDSGTITIPYCFVTDPPSSSCADYQGTPQATISAAELAVYSNALEHSWTNAERIKLQYKGMCDRINDTSEKFVIWVFGLDEDDLTYKNSGQASPGAPGTIVNTVTCPSDANMKIYSNGHMTYSRDRMNYVAIHELGHGLAGC